MTFNAALLDSTLALIERLEAEGDETSIYRWHQGAWISSTHTDEDPVVDETGLAVKIDCQTAFCFAGWVAQEAGGVWANDFALHATLDDDAEDVFETRVIPIDEQNRELPSVVVSVVTASDRAQRLLGIDGVDAGRLFSGGNSLADLRQIVAELKADYGVDA